MLKIIEAVNCLNENQVILVPTDTNYALAVDPFNQIACEKIYSLKGRDTNKPLTLFFAEPEDVWDYICLNHIQKEFFLKLINKYWPGPLNIVVPKSKVFEGNPYINKNSISVVCNQNNTLKKILKNFKKPIAMSSANISGVTNNSLISYENSVSIFGDKIGYCLKDQSADKHTNLSSTIVSLLNNELKIIRQGDIYISLD